MRSAERFFSVFVCAAGLAACAEMMPVPLGGAAVPPPPSASAQAASVPGGAASAAKAASAEPPIPETAQRVFDDSRRALRAGRIDEAERGFKSLTRSYPDLAGPHANLGIVYRQQGKLSDSVAELEAATRANPDRAIYFNQLGITYRQQGEFKKARSAYERAIEIDARYPAAVLNLAILHDIYLWDGARALELYDRYLALTPDGDPTVSKWIADLKNRKPGKAAAGRKEKE